MDWKLKSEAFQMLNHAGPDSNVYYFLQRQVTGSLPRSQDNLIRHIETVHRHYKTILKYLSNPDDAVYYEFGGGWDLCSNLLMYSYGFNRQIVLTLTDMRGAI